MRKLDIHSSYVRIINALSFSSELYKLRRELNAKIDMPSTIEAGMRTHAVGVSRWFKNRRISIAEAYLMVVRDLESKHYKARLRALRVMLDASFHAKTLDMPLNTARVQLALIKEAVKNRGNRRRQLELLQDFSISSHGQQQVIRRLLDELNIVELPETGARLKNLDAGRDEHVHDAATSGRKNPTQLLIDAFIKGISELTIAYTSMASLDMMKEALDAGRILGIRVSIGLELSIQVHGHRFHFMALLPQFKNGKEAGLWFGDHASRLKTLFEGLKKNQQNREEAVRDLLKYFNATSLKEINDGFPDLELYSVPRLRMKDLTESVPLSIVNRMHLGEFLYERYKPVLFNRVMLVKLQHERALRSFRRKSISEWEYRIIKERYTKLRAEYHMLNPDELRARYFTNTEIGDYQTVFDNIDEIKALLAASGCRLKVLHPLEYGFAPAKRLLEASRGIIDLVELYNMQDSVHRDPQDILNLATLINDLNIESARRGNPGYVPVCGSDSTGRSRTIPGMGFIREDRISGKYRKRYIKRHVSIPPMIAAMIEAGGSPIQPESAATASAILSMGKTAGARFNLLGDEDDGANQHIPVPKAWRYLNPALVNFCYTAIGFVVANRFIGTFYAFLWLFITGFRNSIADLVAGRGARLSSWNLKSINFDNVARSLFWTGFSVPIMGFVKAQFDVLWPLEHSGILFDATKFFFISFSNGLYLATHNTFRGFDRKVVRANFFRSVLSWPFATLFSPLGTAMGIPSIVQVKMWSDVIAGFIEGGNKYLKILGLRRRDLEEIVPQILSGDREERFSALIDLLFLFREEPRTESSLRAVLDAKYRPMLLLKIERDTYSFGQFYAAVMNDRMDNTLVSFILARYTPEMATELINLVAITLPSLREWLTSHARQFREIDQPDSTRAISQNQYSSSPTSSTSSSSETSATK
ncbi:MAG TPA: hypothetical protein VMX33_12490 [bacterium]|nr:hypothetical protein [bacterium]